MCNGSTPDSDSVCEGSNPSSAAKNTATPLVWLYFFACGVTNPHKCIKFRGCHEVASETIKINTSKAAGASRVRILHPLRSKITRGDNQSPLELAPCKHEEASQTCHTRGGDGEFEMDIDVDSVAWYNIGRKCKRISSFSRIFEAETQEMKTFQKICSHFSICIV